MPNRSTFKFPARRHALIAATLAIGASTLAGPVSAATGPYLVKDINGSGASNPSWLTPVDDILFFSAKGPKGRELWKSDGTTAGTVRVKDIRAGAGSSNPRDLVNVGGTLFFLANDGSHGQELWKSDGTAAGTVMVEDITLGTAGTPIGPLTNAAGVLFFFISQVNDHQELWTSDGSPQGTSMVAELTDQGGQPPEPLLTIFTTLFFQFSDAGVPTIWSTDGDPENTGPVDYLLPAAWLIHLNGTFYFSHFDAASGIELWKSDGTPGGIELVKDIDTSDGESCNGSPTTCSSEPDKPVILNGVLYFGAWTDGYSVQGLWRSDGTEAGTYQVSDVQFPWQLTKLGNRLIFAGYPPDDRPEVWRTNGTSSGTMLVKRLAPVGEFGSSPSNLIRVGNRVYFTADPLANPFHNPSNDELYRTDGTKAGTKVVMDINPSGASRPASLTNVAATLYFTADDGTHGRELWTYVP